MGEAKPTPGPWLTHREGFSTIYIQASIGGGWVQEIAACGPTNEGGAQQEANARLIADAGTVFHTTGLTPSQLVERVKELEGVVRAGHSDIDGMPFGDLLAAANVLRNNGYSRLAERLEFKHESEIAAISKARPNTAEGEAAAEDEGISREQWIDQAVRVYLIAGDTEEEAYECAKALCREQNWDPLQDDLADPYDAAMSDIEGRGPAPAAAKEPSP